MTDVIFSFIRKVDKQRNITIPSDIAYVCYECFNKLLTLDTNNKYKLGKSFKPSDFVVIRLYSNGIVDIINIKDCDEIPKVVKDYYLKEDG